MAPNATVAIAPTGDAKESHGIHGLHLLSTVVDSFLGNVRNQQVNRNVPIETPNYGVQSMSLPLVSTCVSPTDGNFNSKTVYSTLREKRNTGKSKDSIPIRVSHPKTSFRNTLLAGRNKLSPRLSVSVSQDLNNEVPNLVPPSPPSYLQGLTTQQKIQELYIQQAMGLIENQNISAPFAPILKACQNANTPKTTPALPARKVSVTALMANGERVVSKKSMAELNYIKHKAVPMREKWMARFLELAEFKKKYGHTKVPHNFPDSPKLAEWQVCIINCICDIFAALFQFYLFLLYIHISHHIF